MKKTILLVHWDDENHDLIMEAIKDGQDLDKVMEQMTDDYGTPIVKVVSWLGDLPQDIRTEVAQILTGEDSYLVFGDEAKPYLSLIDNPNPFQNDGFQVTDWETAKKHVHDASGIANPSDHAWQMLNNVFYPI